MSSDLKDVYYTCICSIGGMHNVQTTIVSCWQFDGLNSSSSTNNTKPVTTLALLGGSSYFVSKASNLHFIRHLGHLERKQSLLRDLLNGMIPQVAFRKPPNAQKKPMIDFWISWWKWVVHFEKWQQTSDKHVRCTSWTSRNLPKNDPKKTHIYIPL